MAQVVDREKAVCQQLLGSEEVRQVGAAKAPAGAAVTLGIDGLLLIKVARVAQIEAPPSDPGLPIAGNPGGQNGVEEVNAAKDGLKQVNWRSETHQVANAKIPLQRANSRVNRGVALLWGFVPRQPAKVDPIKRQRADVGGRFGAQFGVDSTLRNAEERLVRAVMRSQRTNRPTMRAIHRSSNLTIGAPLWHHWLIKCNGDIGGKRLLHLNRSLRRKEVHRTVKMTAKTRTLFVDAHQWPKGDHLKSTRVGQDRSIPLHELVKATETLHPFMAWAQIEVIGVGEDDLGTKRLQLFWIE